MSTTPVLTLDVVIAGALVGGVADGDGEVGGVAGSVVDGVGSVVASAAGGVAVVGTAALEFADDDVRSRALPMATPPTNDSATTMAMRAAMERPLGPRGEGTGG